MPAVSDSSPLILFAAIGRLDLLREIYDEIMVPPAVWQEIVVVGAGRRGATDVAAAPWIRRRSPPSQGVAALAGASLDPGETEAIALAIADLPGGPILLDDRRARRLARQAGLAVTGTVGVLVPAKRLGLVAAVRPVLAELRTAGLYLDDKTAEDLLRITGER
jgi:predicted nucleic acid-binding protein